MATYPESAERGRVDGTTTAQVEESIQIVTAGITTSWLAWRPTIPGNSTTKGRSGERDSATLIAASVRREACEEVAGWVRILMDEHDVEVAVSGYDMPAMCLLLAENARWLSGHEAAPDMLYELGQIAYRLDGLLPRGRSTRFRIGSCPDCQSDVSGEADEEHVKCRHCGKRGSWRQWETWLLGERDLMTSPGLAEFIRQAVGITVSGATIWRWIKAGYLTAEGSAPASIGVSGGTPLYDPWAAVLVALHRESRVAA